MLEVESLSSLGEMPSGPQDFCSVELSNICNSQAETRTQEQGRVS